MPNFNEDFEFSKSTHTNNKIREILLDNIPAAIDVKDSTPEDDKNGVDKWVIRKHNLHPLSVDVKSRRDDPKEKGWGDDLALETFSNVDNKIIGWTRDERKKCDYILWFFEPTNRSVLVPFPMLCKVYQELWEEWKVTYKTSRQDNGSWFSESTFVPREIIWNAISNRFEGKFVERRYGKNFSLLNFAQVIE